MLSIKTVTVIGANGTMGQNVSAIFASFGNVKVYMVCRSLEKSISAIEKASKSVRSDIIKNNLIPRDYSSLEECVKESDLVFESVFEDLEIKRTLTKQIGQFAHENTIICTGTSGLSISELSKVLPEKLRRNYLGLHMYNPPYNMTLCELIPSDNTDKDILNEVNSYAKEVLYRTTVIVKDAPAFLGNRIGFQFINEAMQYAEQYKDNGGIDYIDKILGPFTGRSMAPLATADFVGLDVHKAIVDNLCANTNDYAHETFILPKFTDQLIEKHMLGKKTGAGLYKSELYDNKNKKYFVYDIETSTFREKMDYHFPFIEKMVECLKFGNYKDAFEILIHNQSTEARLCIEFMLKYIVYALNTAKLVGYDIAAADDVMAAGFNWCPPLALIEAMFGKENVLWLVKERLSVEILDRIHVDELFTEVKKSKYDYRRFIRARK